MESDLNLPGPSNFGSKPTTRISNMVNKEKRVSAKRRGSCVPKVTKVLEKEKLLTPSAPIVLEQPSHEFCSSKASINDDSVESENMELDINQPGPSHLRSRPTTRISNMNNEHPIDPSKTECTFGEMLWSQIKGYPFWPCMVTYDPLKLVCSRKTTVRYKGHDRQFTEYHVQYFGKSAIHGWTSRNNVLLFEGKEKFDLLIKSMIRKASNLSNRIAKKKMISKYLVYPKKKNGVHEESDRNEKNRKKWEEAVEEAELAFKMDRHSRIEKFVFEYTMSNKMTGETKEVKIPSPIDKSQANTIAARKCDNLFDQVCQMCEKTNCDMKCIQCFHSFHRDCLAIVASSEQFICNECSSATHCCFECKKIDQTTRKCSLTNCGKHYHFECLQKYAMADKDKFICPLHSCLSCYNDNPQNSQVYKGRFVKCIRCPTAFHFQSSCVAAGTCNITQNVILCPQHFVPAKGRSDQSVVNICWCFECGSVGKLICCETCPSAFHPGCLDSAQDCDQEKKFYCEDCVERRYVRVHDIVWAKSGQYRWWPAVVKDVKDLPLNVLSLKHSVGEFPVQFFGTKEYLWIHKGRAYPYAEGDSFVKNVKKNNAENEENYNKEDTKAEVPKPKKKKLEDYYKLALEEAAEAFLKREKYKSEKAYLDEKKPPSYKHIKFNKPVSPVRLNSCDIMSYSKCTCSSTDLQPCGYNSNCINRSTLVECHPAVCPAKDRCQNQMFQQRQYVDVTVFRTSNRGWGLKTKVDIKKGQFVIEYVGDLINQEECQKRLASKHANGERNFYFLTIDRNIIIDAGPRGNHSRFMNHSCEPNCETQKWHVNGNTRIGLFANSDIPAGTELTFDYRLEIHGNAALDCFCGAELCRGSIGLKRSGKNELMPNVKRKKV